MNKYSSIIVSMKNRDQRIQLIKKIISEEVISSQDNLQIRLLEKGCDVTQATLSRDLKSLHVMKVSDTTNGYIYRLAGSDMGNQQDNSDVSRFDFLSDGVVGIEKKSSFSYGQQNSSYKSDSDHLCKKRGGQPPTSPE